MSRDAAARQSMDSELAKRYGEDYQIVVCAEPAGLAALLAAQRAAGTPVALVISGIGGQDPDGIETLSAVHPIDSTALRVTAFRWGELETAGPIFDAVTLGKIDHWLPRPEGARDEEFHRSITEFLSEWGTRRGGGFEALRLIGEQWSPRSQELRDTFSATGSRSASTTPLPSTASTCWRNWGSPTRCCRSWCSGSGPSTQRWSTRRTWTSPRPSASPRRSPPTTSMT